MLLVNLIVAGLLVSCISKPVEGQRFDRAIRAYEGALADRDGMSLDLYTQGAREIQGMVRKFGKLFAFADGEFIKMVGNLERLGVDEQTGERNPAYATIQSAIDYELRDKTPRTKRPSAVSSVSKLLWALKYLSIFARKLSTMNDNDNAAQAAKRTYSELFGKSHSWLIRTAVNLAVRTLPKKRNLVQKMMDDDEECAQNEELRNAKLAKFATVSQEIVDVLDKFYASRNIQ